jgi:Large polyvalent protein-associated domain 1
MSRTNAPLQQQSLLSQQLSQDKTTRRTRRTQKGKMPDAGEKIRGARKDQWAIRGLILQDLDTLTPGHAATIVTKHNIWQPDYPALIESGCEPTAAALIKLIYDPLIVRPKDNTVEGRKRYVTAMRAVREVLIAARTLLDVKRAQVQIIARIRGADSNDPPIEVSQWRGTDPDILCLLKGPANPLSISTWDIRRARLLIEAGFPNIDPWRSRLEITEEGGPGVTEHGIQLFVKRAAQLNCTLTPNQVRQGIYRVRLKCKPRTEFAYAATRPEALTAAARAYDLLRKRGGTSGAIRPERPYLDVLTRAGLPPRRGRRGDAYDFIDTFGFRGVEFGNWAASDERERHVHLAFEALWDLADVLNVEPAALSLNGALAVALGARGAGARAHYEAGRRVFNVAKTSGAGALAHEFGHAFDHYFGELDRPDAYQTDARGATGWHAKGSADLRHLRPEIRAAWDRINSTLYQRDRTQEEAVACAAARVTSLEESILRDQTWLTSHGRSLSDTTGPGAELRPLVERRAAQLSTARIVVLALTNGLIEPGRYGSVETEYYRNAQRLCGKHVDKGYWVRPTEMFARAFEAYVFDRLRDRGAQSDYLVHGVEADRFASAVYLGNPYPDRERGEINAAINDLVQAVRTRPGNKGLPALY